MSKRKNPLFASLDEKEEEIIKSNEEVKQEEVTEIVQNPPEKVETPVVVEVDNEKKEPATETPNDDNEEKKPKRVRKGKGVKKKAYGFSLNIEMMNEFQEFCDEKAINISLLVERLITKHLEEENKKA